MTSAEPFRDELAADHEELLQFLYLCPAGIIQATLDGAVVLLNPKVVQLLMPVAPSGAFENLFTLFENHAPELRNMTSTFGEATGTICEGHRVQLNAGRSDRPAEVLTVTLVKIGRDRLVAVINDISAQVTTERKLKETEAWFAAIASGVTDYAILTLDSGGRIDSWNATGERVTGHAAVEVLGEPISIFYPDGAMPSERLHDLLDQAEENGWNLDEGWRLKADGSRFWCSSMIAPLDPGSGSRGYSLILRDISERHQTAEEVTRLSHNDHLTGVANRRTFYEAASQEEARCRRYPRPLSLVLIDADHFKRINDTFGHPAGDKVLQNLASRTRTLARDLDLVARLGGEEFVILMPSTGIDGAEIFADRLRQDIEAQAVEADGRTIRYTISLGVAEAGSADPSIESLMKRADEALYRAKHGGRNQVARADRA